MKIAIAHITGVAPYSQSRFHDTPKLNKENPKNYELRTWRERLHTDKDGMVFIPPLAFKNCIAEIAKYLSIKIEGKGQATYTKHFESGILVVDDIPLGIHKDDVLENWVHVPANGVRGAGKRVMKCYPLIPSGWTVKVPFLLLDDVITQDVFEYHLKQAGQLIGVGTFRVRNLGTFGRFRVDNIDWKLGTDAEDLAA